MKMAFFILLLYLCWKIFLDFWELIMYDSKKELL